MQLCSVGPMVVLISPLGLHSCLRARNFSPIPIGGDTCCYVEAIIRSLSIINKESPPPPGGGQHDKVLKECPSFATNYHPCHFAGCWYVWRGSRGRYCVHSPALACTTGLPGVSSLEGHIRSRMHTMANLTFVRSSVEGDHCICLCMMRRKAFCSLALQAVDFS